MEDWNALMPRLINLEQNYAIWFHYTQRPKLLLAILFDELDGDKVFRVQLEGERFEVLKQAVLEVEEFLQVDNRAEKYKVIPK